VKRTLIELKAKGWLCRGVPTVYDNLLPSIDRPPKNKPRATLSYKEKLSRERASINLVRSISKYHSELPLEIRESDRLALAWMRHYGVPTRLLDWSRSPYIAAFFATAKEGDDGDLWAFDYEQYLRKGDEQWKCIEDAMDRTTGKDVFQFDSTAFQLGRPPEKNWIVCLFYEPQYFPRHNAQQGFYTVAANLGTDHAIKLAELLKDEAYFCRYRIASRIKAEVQLHLRECHGVWSGTVYPDLAGTMSEVKSTLFGEF